jgi:coatomer subunit beta
VVVLNDVHIDIMDYIQPSVCSDTKFAQMWIAFEWENKVTVNTQLRELSSYLTHLVGATNMRCLTPPQSLSGDCCFLAANLYARSIFGEDALANVSIEKATANGPITGHIRIRAKSQGMALSLGDRVNAAQKTLPSPTTQTSSSISAATTTSQGL